MAKPELVVAQELGERPVYPMEDLVRITGSRATAYRILGDLRRLGFALELRRGYFFLRSSFFQPFYMWQHLVPSLKSLTLARRFGRSYNEGEVGAALRILKGTTTLDYRAYELTAFQRPYSFFTYVDDLDLASAALRHQGFWEGTRGRVVIMPRIGSLRNEVQRVYLDCIAYGGRSTLDAIAIEMLHGGDLDPRVRGVFRLDDVLKVKEGLAPGES